MLLGETGSGKEVAARQIHVRSARAKGPFLRVNCGAIPTELVDSELFGHDAGSFTGAVATRRGWFERADGGTLFLDELGELPAAAQVRMLRVLQDGTFERVGGQQTITVDVRIVAATNANLQAMVDAGTFRRDLWYRLSVFPISIPPLRDRREDIPVLAAHFAHRAGMRLFGATPSLSPADVNALIAYDWPGNVRELAAVIERAAILGGGHTLDVGKALGVLPARAPVATSQSADAQERASIEAALQRCHGRIEGPFGAAKALRVNPHTLRSRMRRLGIDWSRFRSADPD
jgi:transcriptional regulator with GAF, ATPase, and Fis domain